MRREQLTEKILDIKREKGWSWKQITDEIGGMSPVLVVGALLGQMKLVKPLAKKAAGLFGLSQTEERMLNEVPHRGTAMPPTDPLIYRFYELVMVNGPAWKALIEEEFGDGIMSAIDFDMEIERLPNPKGDRVKITMSGKFLPFKYYGNEQGIQEYGVKETSSVENGRARHEGDACERGRCQGVTTSDGGDDDGASASSSGDTGDSSPAWPCRPARTRRPSRNRARAKPARLGRTTSTGKCRHCDCWKQPDASHVPSPCCTCSDAVDPAAAAPQPARGFPRALCGARQIPLRSPHMRPPRLNAS